MLLETVTLTVQPRPINYIYGILQGACISCVCGPGPGIEQQPPRCVLLPTWCLWNFYEAVKFAVLETLELVWIFPLSTSKQAIETDPHLRDQGNKASCLGDDFRGGPGHAHQADRRDRMKLCRVTILYSGLYQELYSFIHRWWRLKCA
jgi:hypothetical protein